MSRQINIPNIAFEINLALLEGYHRFIVVVGEKNLGKSTLCLGLLYEIFKNYSSDWEGTWENVFRHLVFTPKQFYKFYNKAKRDIDTGLTSIGLDPNVLEYDVEEDWDKIVESVLKSNIKSIEGIREKFRIKGILIDDIGAHMNRGDVSIYHDPFFQKLFGDLTLIRPYIACILASAPDITDIPRVILKHVTDIIQVESQGFGKYKKKKRFIRFKGKQVEGYMKLYDGEPIEWNKLPSYIYTKYEVLRHVMSRYVSQQAEELLNESKIFTLKTTSLTETKSLVEPSQININMSFSLIQIKKQLAESLKFQGLRVTESYNSTDPDLVIWEDATNPREVIAIRGVKVD